MPLARLPEPGKADRELYGVDRPWLTVKVRAGRVYEVRLGAESPSGTSRYAYCPQGGVWALVGADVAKKLERLATRQLPGD
jgi:hypothetical protein